MQVTFRNGKPEDWTVLRLLLPDVVQLGSGLASILAETPDQKIIGALAVKPRLRGQPLPGVHLAAHVIPPARNSGIARGMIQAIEPWARQHGAQALYAWGAIPPHSPAEKIWRKLGFDHTSELQEGIFRPADTIEKLTHTWNELVARNKIPSQAQMTSLKPEHVPAILRLHLAHFGGDAGALAQELNPESPAARDPEICAVLLFDGHPIGYFLAVRTGPTTARVDATVVDPAHRSGWANLWLKREGVLRCLNLGIEELHFYTFAQHADTRRFVSKVGLTVKTLVEPYRVLT